jgi:acetolactate synthase I/III small subunit
MPVPDATSHMVLELEVRNHPGVMSHICNLFSRRAYNVEGIVCLPIGPGERSRIFLKVVEDERLDQVVKQIEKLPDVHSVRPHDPPHQVFVQIATFF